MSAVPPMIRWLSATDGIRLLVRHYRPENNPPQRTFLWCHGLGEHGGRYEHVVAEILARGWQVVLPDLRGHGRSEGVRTDVESFQVYLDDFDRIVQEFALEPSRTVLFGHSMGALVMIRFAQTRPQGWSALALSAPLLGIALSIPWWKWLAGRLLVRLAPQTHLKTGIREDNLTSDPTFLAARRADPLIQRTVTVRWFFAMRDALDQAYLDAPTLTLPILVLQGMKDRTTDPQAPHAWLQTTRSSDSRLIEFPNGLHELLNDRDWHKVSTALLDWLDEHLPPPQSPFP